jgi:stage IV sporulation protein A
MKQTLTNEFDLYRDIQARTKGEIYIGVVGPCRTGKSTFIKRFMDEIVIDRIEDENLKKQTIDELPQSAQGRTIMTTEPKFIPKEAVEIALSDDTSARVRLIDCVGYMVEGAGGHMEDGKERLVHTPWSKEEIPFTQAAEIGTKKVICDHSTIGIIVTSDGSFGELPRESFVAPEQRTVAQLKEIGKPFLIILNSKRPYSGETKQLAEELEKKYGVTVMAQNCEQLKKDDLIEIMRNILLDFPVSRLNFYIPKWTELLPQTHPVKQCLIENAAAMLADYATLRDVTRNRPQPNGEYIKSLKIDDASLANGEVSVTIEVEEKYYYENISRLAGVPVSGEYELISLLREMSAKKQEYERVSEAVESVESRGYGVVVPDLSQIQLEQPQIIRHGNKYGVKIKALSPSIHMIRANIETEIAPIIGSEEQAQELIRYLSEQSSDKDGIWETNIFGKSVGELVKDGVNSKLMRMSEESRMKLQETMQKIVNESNGGLVCIII